MRYEVFWHDYQNKRSGEPFKIEGSDPSEAYYNAEEHIKSLSPYFRENYCELGIESLVDEQGKYHYPEIFFKKSK